MSTSRKNSESPLKNRNSLFPSLKISAIYFVISFLWIFFSDRLLENIATDLTHLSHYQTIKGVGFITITTLIIFGLIYRKMIQRNKMIETINEKEQKYRRFISQITEGIFRFETGEPIPLSLPIDEQVNRFYENAYLAECNNAFAELYGLKKESLLNIKISDYHKLIGSKEGKNFVRKFIKSGYQLENVIAEEKKANENTIFLSKNITGIISNNMLTSAWGSQRNITDRKKYEKDLLKAKKKAEESDQLKSAFLANMSHEIRTPLNSILGFSHLMSRENLSKEQKEKFISIIRNNSKQLLNIINDILDISKIEAQQIKIAHSEFSLNNLLNEIKTLYVKNEERKRKKLELKTHIDLPEGNDFICADKERLMQILQNLINNAVKFTASGQIYLGYTKKGQELEFFVKDSGIGISKNKQKNIFKRFQQENLPNQAISGGTGLGLSISKGLVELMHGKIWVESEEGTGTTFFFTIPYKPAENKQKKAKQDEITDWLSQKTILVVEDDKYSYELLDHLLGKYNAKTINAEDGNKAIELVKKNPEIDLVLMDLRLPGKDGFETTKEIKKIRKKLPVIAQSAYAMTEDKIKSNDAGCDDFLPKPIEEKKLFAILNKYLD